MADNTTPFMAPLESPFIHTRSPGAIAVMVLSFLAVLLCVPPFVWHIKTRNIAASGLVAWVMLIDLFTFINVNIWPTDNLTSWWDGTGLCDIQVKIMIAATVGIMGSLACIFRSLAIVLDTDNTVLVPSTSQRRRRLAFEIFFCFVFPAYFIIIHYVVQPSRYYIFGITGCTPSFDNSWVIILLVFVWPPVICLLACFYCCKSYPLLPLLISPTNSIKLSSYTASTNTAANSPPSSPAQAPTSTNPASSASSSSPSS